MDKIQTILNNLSVSGILNYPTDSEILINFLFKNVDTLEREVEKKITPANWKNKKKEVLDNLKYSIGMDNIPKTGLNAEVTGKIEKDRYHIEKVIIESIKGIYIPAHLYMPKEADFPIPAILHVSGHWLENAKMEPDLQSSCIALAKHGFIVLSTDPIEQGERRSSWKNHGHLQTLLTGITPLGMMVYENIKAIDYLVSRDEVDKDKIGMMGTSNGGFNTAVTSAIDERINAAVVIGYAATYRWILEGHKGYNWNSGNDVCNQLPNIISKINFTQILALSTPRRLMIVNAIDDNIIPIEGAKKVYEKAKLFFDLYSSNLLSQVVVPGGHKEGKDERQAAYGFFLKYLKEIGDGSPVKEPEIKVEEPPYDINWIDATADKNKSQSFYPKKGFATEVFSNPKYKDIKKPLKEMLYKKYTQKYPAYIIPNTLDRWKAQKKGYHWKLDKILVKTIDASSLNPRIVSSIASEHYFVERVVFDSEAGIKITGLLFLPNNWDGPNKLWICSDDMGKIGFIKNPIFRDLIENNQAVFAIDLRGQGESLAVEFEVATISYMIDRNLLSQRVFDLLRALDYISQRISMGIQLDKQTITCYGRGDSALVALFAAAADDRISSLVTENQIVSYRSLLDGDSGFSPSIYIYDIVSSFEIDDICSMIFPRPLAILDPIDRNKNVITKNKISKEFPNTRKVYTKFWEKDKLLIKKIETSTRLNVVKQILHR